MASGQTQGLSGNPDSPFHVPILKNVPTGLIQLASRAAYRPLQESR